MLCCLRSACHGDMKSNQKNYVVDANRHTQVTYHLSHVDTLPSTGHPPGVSA